MDLFDEESDIYKQGLMDDLVFFIDHNVRFDGKIVDIILDQYEKTEKLTPNQWQALRNIHREWKVSEYCQIRKYRSLINLDFI